MKADNILGSPVSRQQLLCFSLITLGTAGYGDVIPVNDPWARMLAGLQVTACVLYIANLMARLVSLYEI
jgi:Ion channel.